MEEKEGLEAKIRQQKESEEKKMNDIQVIFLFNPYKLEGLFA